ncbi:hypothetical protein TorRG33x02_235000 [Trema orientale]|uniref:Uncharacterized protein n=1 Tax=Trema orientale TaxID=63057 RepID=A0A2P5E2X4_TREOI|nr:hypothetical protein TorRG33x02_235000 [Trema orientale]
MKNQKFSTKKLWVEENAKRMLCSRRKPLRLFRFYQCSIQYNSETEIVHNFLKIKQKEMKNMLLLPVLVVLEKLLG